MSKSAISLLRKAAVFIVGALVIIVGIILLPLPGPGLLVILGGLLILATEFEWANKHVIAIRTRLKKSYEKIKRRQAGDRSGEQ